MGVLVCIVSCSILNLEKLRTSARSRGDGPDVLLVHSKYRKSLKIGFQVFPKYCMRNEFCPQNLKRSPMNIKNFYDCPIVFVGFRSLFYARVALFDAEVELLLICSSAA